MAYIKQTWEDAPSTNTPITAARLNHMEEGIEENSILVEGIKSKVMWRNPNPIAVFNATGANNPIFLEDFDYDFLDFYYYLWTDIDDPRLGCTRIPNLFNNTVPSKRFHLQGIFVGASGKLGVGERNVHFNNDNNDKQVIFGNAQYADTQSGVPDPVNSVCVPFSIIGYKINEESNSSV